MSDPSAQTGFYYGGFPELTATPTTIALTVVGTRLSWAASGATSYLIYAGVDPTAMFVVGELINVGSTPTFTYTVQAVNASNPCYVQVIGDNGIGSQVVLMNNGTGTVTAYYGFAPNATPNAGQVQALSSRAVYASTGTYTLTQSPGPGYPCIAFPASLSVVTPFVIDGFDYNFPVASVTISSVAYNVYTLATPTYAATLTIGVS